MTVDRRHRMAPRLALAGLVFGIAGTLAWAQAPAGSQKPPPPPEPQAPPPPLDAPKTEALPATADPSDGQAADRRAAREIRVEGEETPAGPTARVYAPNEPPPPIAERRSGRRPGPRAVWTPGYWEWDPDDARFVWVGGSWRVPPAGMVWTPGRWARDPRGWYFVAGDWTPRADRAAVAANRPAWRVDGPPAEHPEDTPPPAPGPDFFYVAGHHAPAPSGDRLTWVPGYWAAIQPGWDWIPARWVRRPGGWDYREGRWIRDPGDVVERAPARDLRRMRRNPDVEVIARDPVTGAEVNVTPPAEPLPAGAVAAGMPYYVIRPPGAYPYGPNGVVVPGAVPPFVRRLLDRVLP